MVRRKNIGVSLKVDEKFFDNVFEKGRKNLQKKIMLKSGMDVRLSTMEFTKILAKNNFNFNVGKIKFENAKAKKSKKR